ncbi:MAG: hypothetical protein ACI9HK_000785 [Pirellulaceae bacterium]|jgi:hypothetical protein
MNLTDIESEKREDLLQAEIKPPRESQIRQEGGRIGCVQLLALSRALEREAAAGLKLDLELFLAEIRHAAV